MSQCAFIRNYSARSAKLCFFIAMIEECRVRFILNSFVLSYDNISSQVTEMFTVSVPVQGPQLQKGVGVLVGRPPGSEHRAVALTGIRRDEGQYEPSYVMCTLLVSIISLKSNRKDVRHVLYMFYFKHYFFVFKAVSFIDFDLGIQTLAK